MCCSSFSFWSRRGLPKAYGISCFPHTLTPGSIFTVYLPADPVVYEEKDFLIPHNVLLEEERHHKDILVEDVSENTSLPVAPLNKRKVLIIEDDNDVREFLKEEVGQYFEVVAEGDGASGLERAATYDADLIICDVLMPGMTGFEVTHKLKNNFDTSHISIIFVDRYEFGGKSFGRSGEWSRCLYH